MRCRLFDYSSDKLNTGITEIDAISDDLSVDSSEFQFTLERSSIIGNSLSLDFEDVDLSSDFTLDIYQTQILVDPNSFGETILLENGSFLISEEYIIGDGVTDKTAQNELFETLDDTVLDFSESNPFGDAGGL